MLKGHEDDRPGFELALPLPAQAIGSSPHAGQQGMESCMATHTSCAWIACYDLTEPSEKNTDAQRSDK